MGDELLTDKRETENVNDDEIPAAYPLIGGTGSVISLPLPLCVEQCQHQVNLPAIPPLADAVK